MRIIDVPAEFQVPCPVRYPDHQVGPRMCLSMFEYAKAQGIY